MRGFMVVFPSSVVQRSMGSAGADMIRLLQQQAGDQGYDMPVLIIIDTLSRTFGSGNPNQPSDMNAFVAACDRLKEATRAHVLVVHHGGKDVDKNEVGNEGLRNASDTVIHIRRKESTIELINEAPKGKQKDDP
jgi:putative DNA primase/helicase